MTEPRLHQVAQRVEDLDRAVAFYGTTLGLPLIARFDSPGMAFFDLGGTRLLLGEQHYSSSIYLAVGDIDEAHRTLTAAGVRFERAPQLIYTDDDGRFGPRGAQEWMAFFWDTERNLLGLVERRIPPDPNATR